MPGGCCTILAASSLKHTRVQGHEIISSVLRRNFPCPAVPPVAFAVNKSTLTTHSATKDTTISIEDATRLQQNFEILESQRFRDETINAGSKSLVLICGRRKPSKGDDR